MLRSQAIRIASTRVPVAARAAGCPRISVRRYATETEAKKPDDNTLLYTALGVVAVGGAYFYFKRNPEDEEKLKKKARADEEEMKNKARESATAARARAGDMVEEGKQKYDDAKDATRKRFDDTRSDVDRKAEEAKARGRSIVDDVKEGTEARYDATKQSVLRARDSTEQLYDDARDATEKKAREIRGDLEKAGDDAKEGWLSWKGWGKSKVDEGEDKLKQGEKDIEDRLDKNKRYAAQKVAEGAEDVRGRAEKRT